MVARNIDEEENIIKENNATVEVIINSKSESESDFEGRLEVKSF